MLQQGVVTADATAERVQTREASVWSKLNSHGELPDTGEVWRGHSMAHPVDVSLSSEHELEVVVGELISTVRIMVGTAERQTLFTLPAEIRTAILEYVLADNGGIIGFKNHRVAGDLILDEAYSASNSLKLLFTCHQLHQDAGLIAFSRTAFVINSLFIANNVPDRLSILHPKQHAALRNIAFVADARHFRQLIEWGEHPWGMQALNLDSITMVLHRSSFWHFLFDYTSDIVRLLRSLHGVKRLVFVRNHALVKGSFKTWYNRLTGLMMKVDHQERYMNNPPNPEKIWWKWNYDNLAQRFCLEAMPARETMDEGTYMEQIAPLMEQWKASVENEEWNPDPRSRQQYP